MHGAPVGTSARALNSRERRMGARVIDKIFRSWNTSIVEIERPRLTRPRPALGPRPCGLAFPKPFCHLSFVDNRRPERGTEQARFNTPGQVEY
jgi:hypothetical protein